jgi:hypothetical protein
MIPIFVTLFATEGLALGAALAVTDAAVDGAVDGVDGLAVPALVQAPAMRVMAARLAAQAESREWFGR